MLAVASETGTSATHVALAWLLHKARASTTALIPILGSRTREQLDGTLGALEVTLAADHIARLDAVSAIALGVPHETFNSSEARLTGGQPGLLARPAVPVA